MPTVSAARAGWLVKCARTAGICVLSGVLFVLPSFGTQLSDDVQGARRVGSPSHGRTERVSSPPSEARSASGAAGTNVLSPVAAAVPAESGTARPPIRLLALDSLGGRAILAVDRATPELVSAGSEVQGWPSAVVDEVLADRVVVEIDDHQKPGERSLLWVYPLRRGERESQVEELSELPPPGSQILVLPSDAERFGTIEGTALGTIKRATPPPASDSPAETSGDPQR